VRENTIEKTLRERVEGAGGRCLKLPAILYRGIPDRLVLLPMGRIFFIELKADKARTDPGRAIHQSAFRKFLQSIGFNALVIQGKDELDQFLNRHTGKVHDR
jgi:hypothetical protein